ncbi:MAG: hypothetical protein HY907_05460 [Deltaproteobacteria bacterium]|nr:hypothetical protein [Deltaproteobacteria bacterium]
MTRLLLIPLLLLASCGDREDIFSRSRHVLGPLPLAGHVAWVDAAREDLVTIEPVASAGGRFSFRVARQPIGRNPVMLGATADRSRALVVTHGTEGGAGYDEEEERLYLLDPSAEEAARIYRLRSPFDSLSLSADGAWAIAWFAGGDAVNPNEVAVTRLDQDPSADNPVLLPIRSYGSRPIAIRYLADLAIGDRDRQVALVFSERYVTFLDLEHLDRRVTTVFLSARDDAAIVRPYDAVVAPGDATDPEGAAPYVFLRAPGVSDVFAVNLKDNPSPVEDDQNDFTPSVNVIPVPSVPDDFAVFEGAGGPALLAVHPAGSFSAVTVIDPRTTASWTVTLDAHAVAIRVFPDVPTRDGPRQVAVLFDQGNRYETSAGFLILDGIEDRLRRNLETIDLGAPVMSVIPTGDPLRVLLVHDSVSGSVSILNVADRTVERLGVNLLTGVLATHPEGRSFFFASPEPNRLSMLELETGHAEDIRLDAGPSALFALPGFTDGGRLRGRALAVDHGFAAGYLTVLPLDAPDRDAAASIQGFLADDMLDVAPERYPGTEVP